MKKALTLLFLLSLTALQAQSLWIKGYAGMERTQVYDLYEGYNDLSQVHVSRVSSGYGNIISPKDSPWMSIWSFF